MDRNKGLEESVVGLLKKYHLKLAAAESLTGGLFSAGIVNVSGASEVFAGGFVTYTDEAKHKLLGVKKSTLAKYTAVSKHTAAQMAKGAAAGLGADVAVSMTGIAGPGGGTIEQPVGLVYIACTMNGKAVTRKYQLEGSRQEIREKTVTEALRMVRYCVRKKYA